MKELLTSLIALLLMSASCNNVKDKNINPGFYKEGFEVNYAFNNPDQRYNLARELTEISGLAYSKNMNRLYAINDEKGNIYAIDMESGDIIDKIDFAKSDDYEGITYNDNVIYVVESNGNVKVVDESLAERITEYDDILSRDNDVEGLTYNPVHDNILLAAKGDSEEDGNDKSYKSLFAMNKENGEIDEKPFLSLNVKEAIRKMTKRYITSNTIVSLSVNSRVRNFSPSGVAIHPTTHDVYIISAKGKLLLITSLSGDIKALIFLNNQLHVQPEGICFDTDEVLYISNEGRGNSGKIYKYLPIK